MSYSSGTRSMAGEVAGWCGAVCLLAVVALNYDGLRHGVAGLMGVVNTGEEAAEGSDARGAAKEPPRSGYTVELDAADNGHFHAEAEINGRPVSVMVDTGATMVALTYEDAERAGVYLKDSDFDRQVSTANGMARIATITLDRISIGDITVHGVKAAVAQRGNLQETLLGMSFLSRLDRVDMRGGKLLLQD